MRTRHLGQIERGLDCQRLCIRRVCKLPVRQRTLLLLLQLVAGLIDQRAGFAMNAGDRIRPQSCDGAKAVQEHVVRDRLHDARHSRHVELERADAEVLGVARDLGNLLFGEDLRVEHQST